MTLFQSLFTEEELQKYSVPQLRAMLETLVRVNERPKRERTESLVQTEVMVHQAVTNRLAHR